MFTGFFTTPGHHALVLTASWIPLNLYLINRTSDSKFPMAIVASAVGLSLMMLSGHPQPAYYGALLTTVWAFYRLGWRRALRTTIPALALAGCLASVQLLPTYQLASESTRADAGYDYSTTFQFSPYLLPSAIAPRDQIRLPGQDPSVPLHIYVGVGGLLLAAAGLACSRRESRWFFFFAAATSLFLSFGSFSFLFDMAYALVPGFKSFRVPYRLLGIYAFAMAALVGFGVDALGSITRSSRRVLAQLVRGAFGFLFIIAIWSAYAHTRLLVSPGALEPQEIEKLIASVDLALLLLMLNLVFLLALLLRRPRSWPVWGIIVLLVLDLGSFVKDRGQHPFRSLVRAGERPIHQLMRAQAERHRYATHLNLENYAMLHGAEFVGGHDPLVDQRYSELLDQSSKSTNVLGILNVKFVARSRPSSKADWCGTRFPSPLPILDIPSGLSPIQLTFTPSIEASSIRILWSSEEPDRSFAHAQVNSGEIVPLTASPWETAFETPEDVRQLTIQLDPKSSGIRIEDIELDGSPLGLLADFIDLGGAQLNLHCLPRAYFVVDSQQQEEQAHPEGLACWTPHHPVQMSDVSTGAVWYGYFRNHAVRILHYAPERVQMEVDSPRAGFVVLADTYRPGWNVTVNGQRQPTLRAQHAMRAVAVPAGSHQVTWTYRPMSLYVGGGLSLLGLLVVLALTLGRRLWSFGYPERHPPSNPQP
jgi:hypothetical protein